MQLQQLFEEATADEQKLEQLRKARLAALEVERTEARRKWRDGLEAAVASVLLGRGAETPPTATPPSEDTSPTPTQTSAEPNVPAAFSDWTWAGRQMCDASAKLNSLESLEQDPALLTNSKPLSPLVEQTTPTLSPYTN